MTLDQETLQGFYPAPTDIFTADMRRLLHELPHQEEECTVRHIPKRIIIAAAIMLALLTTTAFALTQPAVLNWLVRGPAGDALIEVAQEVDAQATGDGVTARVTSLVWDGKTLVFSFDLESADTTNPALVLLDREYTIGGRPYTTTMPTEDSMYMLPSTHLDIAPVKRNPITSGEWLHRVGELSGEVEVNLTFRVYRPKTGIAYFIPEGDPLRHIEKQDADFQADLLDKLHCLQGMNNVVIPDVDQLDALYWLEQGYYLAGWWERPDVPAGYQGDQLTWNEQIQEMNANTLVETAMLPLSFTFDADKARHWDFSDTPDVALDDHTVHVRDFELSPLMSTITIELYPSENTREAAQHLADMHGQWMITDGNGEEIRFSEMDNTMWTDEPNVAHNTETDVWYCYYALDMGGLEKFPTTLVFRTETGALLRFDLAD